MQETAAEEKLLNNTEIILSSSNLSHMKPPYAPEEPRRLISNYKSDLHSRKDSLNLESRKKGISLCIKAKRPKYALPKGPIQTSKLLKKYQGVVTLSRFLTKLI